MFLEFVPETSALSKNKLGCYTLCCFLLHKTSWACLLGSGLKFMKHMFQLYVNIIALDLLVFCLIH